MVDIAISGDPESMSDAVVGAPDAGVRDKAAAVARPGGLRAAQPGDLQADRLGDAVQGQFTARHGPTVALKVNMIRVKAHLRVALYLEPVGRAETGVHARVFAGPRCHL